MKKNRYQLTLGLPLLLISVWLGLQWQDVEAYSIIFPVDLRFDGQNNEVVAYKNSTMDRADLTLTPTHHLVMLPFAAKAPNTPTPTNTPTTTPTSTPPLTTHPSIADASLLEGAPNLNDDPDPTMWVGYFHCGSAKITRGLMKFNLDTVPANAAIVHAKLHLFLYGSCDLANRAHTVSVYSVLDPWAEETVTWNTQPTMGSLLGSGTVQSRSYGWYSIDVTNLVKQWVSGALPNNGLLLRGPESSDNQSAMLEFLTRNAPAAYVPYLEITYAGGAQVSAILRSASSPPQLPVDGNKKTAAASVHQPAGEYHWEEMESQSAPAQ